LLQCNGNTRKTVRSPLRLAAGREADGHIGPTCLDIIVRFDIDALLGREDLAEPLPLLAGEAHELQLLDRQMVTLAGIDLDAGQ
jgi:hypothetical protein